jgi:hypothetical protein
LIENLPHRSAVTLTHVDVDCSVSFHTKKFLAPANTVCPAGITRITPAQDSRRLEARDRFVGLARLELNFAMSLYGLINHAETLKGVLAPGPSKRTCFRPLAAGQTPSVIGSRWEINISVFPPRNLSADLGISQSAGKITQKILPH